MLATSSSMSSFEGIVTAAKPFILASSASTSSLIPLAAISSRTASTSAMEAILTRTNNEPSRGSLPMLNTKAGAAFVVPQTVKRGPLRNVKPEVAQKSAFLKPASMVLSPFEPALDNDTEFAHGLDVSKLIPKEHSLRASLNVADETIDEHYGAELRYRSRCRPWIVGHRGAIFRQLENTRESFLKSFELGSDAVELDVFLLKDNTLVCYHGFGHDATPGDLSNYFILNENTDDTSNGSTSILDLDYEQTQQLNFNPFYEEFPCDPSVIRQGKIPKLEQVLVDAKRLGKQVKIELKGPGTVEPILELVEKLDMVHQCQFSSFNFELLGLLRKLRPEEQDVDSGGKKYPSYVYRTGALFDVPVPVDFIDQAKKIGASEIHLRYDVCTSDRVKAIHNAGLGSMAWFRGPIGMKDGADRFWDVGNEDERMYQAVLDTGVQQMCVNKPDVLVEMVRKQQEQEQNSLLRSVPRSPTQTNLKIIQPNKIFG